MRLQRIPALLLSGAAAGLVAIAAGTEPRAAMDGGNWPQWRGPLHTGEATRLDDAHEAGQLEDAAYQAQRADLKGQLAAMWYKGG